MRTAWSPVPVPVSHPACQTTHIGHHGTLTEPCQAPTHHRLDLAGNRQVNSTLHLMHVTQVRSYPPARDYIAKKRAEHKTKREARRAHKRHLANVVIRRMWADHTQRFETVADQATPAAA